MTSAIAVNRRQHDERGMTTAEYAAGTVATVSVVGVLISIFQNDEFRRILWDIIQYIIQLIFHLLGGGSLA